MVARKIGMLVLVTSLVHIPSEIALLFFLHRGIGTWVAIWMTYAISLIQFSGEWWVVKESGMKDWWSASFGVALKTSGYCTLLLLAFAWRMSGIALCRIARLRGGECILLAVSFGRLIAVAEGLKLLFSLF